MLQDVGLDVFARQKAFLGHSTRIKGAVFADLPVCDVVMSLLKEAKVDGGFALAKDPKIAPFPQLRRSLSDGKVYRHFVNFCDVSWETKRALHSGEVGGSQLVYSNRNPAFKALQTGALPAWTMCFLSATAPLIKDAVNV